MHPVGHYAKTQSIKGFQPEIIDTLIEQDCHFLPRFSPLRPSLSWSREPRRCVGNCFCTAQDHLMELIAAWEPQDDEQRHIQWAQNVSQAGTLHLCLRGGYISLLDEQQERVRLAFGSNYERLLDLKQKYDPDDVFRSTIGHLAPICSTR